MSLVVVGCNHRTAPIHLRERLALGPEAAARAIERLTSEHAQAEAAVLSTCNRAEVYIASLHEEPQAQWAIDLLAADAAIDRAQLALHLYTYEDAQAVEHLFRVASSLDSMVVGEVQIIAQVKEAYARACEQGATGPILNALFQRALNVAKKVHASTGIGQARVSISSLAVDFARRVFDRFTDKTVLLIGAGKIGSLTLRHLAEFQPGRILVANRRYEKAVALAAQFQGEPRPFDRLAEALVEADVVISCTGSPEPIVRAADFRPLLDRRRHRPMFIVDIAVPRDFEPAIGDLENIYLYNIDDLDRVRQQNLQRRQRQVDRCLEIVAQETAAFMADLAAFETAPVIGELQEQLSRVREAEFRRLLNKLGNISPEHQRQIAYTLLRLQRKFMHPTVLAMKQEVAGGRGHPLLSAVRRLLGMDD